MRELVLIESPFKAETLPERMRKVAYADALMLDSIKRGEAPFLGHLLYPRVLDDADPEERGMGIECHLQWLGIVSRVVVGMDLGKPSAGMRTAIDLADGRKVPLEPRWLGEKWDCARYKRTAWFV